MNDEIKKRLADLRAQIKSELGQKRKALVTAQEEESAAVTAAIQSSAAHKAIEALFAPISDAQPGFAAESLAGPLALHVHEHKQRADEAGSQRTRAQNACRRLTARIAELELSLRQLDRLSGEPEGSSQNVG